MRNVYRLITLFVLFGAADTARAQGILIPDAHGRVVPIVRLDSHRVEAVVTDQRAHTTVQQVFVNESGRQMEATYLFPIPESASVGDFTMWVDGKEMSGELVEAARARRIYEDIVRQTRDPGLLEYAGQDCFRARVFPVPPNGDVRIEVVYSQVLTFDSGLIEYRYPIAAPSRTTSSDGHFSFSARIESKQPIKSVYSPNYDIERRLSRDRATVGYEGAARDLSGDMTVLYSVSSDDVGLSLVCSKQRRRDGHFMLLLSPGRVERPEHVIAKDIVFVVDRSGSMAGEKIEQTRDALRYCLSQLGSKDRFGIVTFATSVDVYKVAMVHASRREKDHAHDFVDDIKARGGTDISGGLEAALDLFDGNRPRFVVFLTDGLPTVGETDIGSILDQVERHRTRSLRLFTFGVGYDVNTRLLDQLSEENRGVVTYVEPVENIEVKVSSFFEKISEPVLANLDIDFGGAEVSDMFPRALPDLFNGGQLVVVGRFDRDVETTIRLTGEVDGESRSFDYPVVFRSDARSFDFVPRIWATRKIAYLLGHTQRHGHDQEVVDEIVDLATRYGIVTPYTSYLILEDDDRHQLGESRWDRVHSMYNSPEAETPPTSSDAFTEVSGRSAVKMSRKVAESKDEVVVSDAGNSAIRYVGSKTFYFDGSEWVDSAYDPSEPTIEIAFLSDEYFDLVAKHSELADYLSLGERVTFVHDGHAYRITPS